MAKAKGAPKTGGRRAGTPNKRTSAGELFARTIVENPEVQARLLGMAKEGTLSPDLLKTLLAYAFGKPVEVVSLDDDRAPRTIQITF